MSPVKTSGKKVALILMKSEEADATLDALKENGSAVTVRDCTTYWQIEADDEIRIEMADVGAELGRPISLSQWLVVMSSFVGRAVPGADYFRVSSHMAGLEADHLDPLGF